MMEKTNNTIIDTIHNPMMENFRSLLWQMNIDKDKLLKLSTSYSGGKMYIRVATLLNVHHFIISDTNIVENIGMMNMMTHEQCGNSIRAHDELTLAVLKEKLENQNNITWEQIENAYPWKN